MGWFKGPRTLPLVLALLSDKRLTDGRDVSRVYLELLARHMDGGVIETEKRPGYAPDPLAELNRYQEFSLKKGAPAVDFSRLRGSGDGLRGQTERSPTFSVPICAADWGGIPETRASYQKALALASQEPDRRFLARRLAELK